MSIQRVQAAMRTLILTWKTEMMNFWAEATQQVDLCPRLCDSGSSVRDRCPAWGDIGIRKPVEQEACAIHQHCDGGLLSFCVCSLMAEDFCFFFSWLFVFSFLVILSSQLSYQGLVPMSWASGVTEVHSGTALSCLHLLLSLLS